MCRMTRLPELSEVVRETLSVFVRRVREQTRTPRTAQWETLHLLEQDGPMTVATLARLRGVKHQSMRLVVAELEDQGLVQRVEDRNDARAQLISLSKAALARLRKSRQARAAWIARRIDRTLSDAEKRDLQRGMMVLRRMLEEESSA